MRYFLQITATVLLALCIQTSVNGAGLLGKKAPEIDVDKWISIHTVKLSELKGNAVVLWFFAPKSEGCKRVTPYLNSLSSAYKSKGIIFVGITREKDADAVKKFVEEYSITYGIGIGPDTFTEYNVAAIPSIVIVDKTGTVAWEGNPSQIMFKLKLKQLAGEKPNVKKPPAEKKEKDRTPLPVKGDDRTAKFIRTSRGKIGSICSEPDKAYGFLSEVRSHISANMSRSTAKQIIALLAQLLSKGKTLEMRSKAINVIASFKYNDDAVNVLMNEIRKLGKKDLTSIEAAPWKAFLNQMIDAVPLCGTYSDTGAAQLYKFITDPQYKHDMETKARALQAMGKIRTIACIEYLLKLYPLMTSYQYEAIASHCYNSLYGLTGVRGNTTTGPRDHARFSDWMSWWRKNKAHYVKKYTEEKNQALPKKSSGRPLMQITKPLEGW
jgi:thiol-disulfide isomerase/thioredoxin